MIQTRLVTEKKKTFGVGIQPPERVDLFRKGKLRQSPVRRSVASKLGEDPKGFVKSEQHDLQFYKRSLARVGSLRAGVVRMNWRAPEGSIFFHVCRIPERLPSLDSWTVIWLAQNAAEAGSKGAMEELSEERTGSRLGEDGRLPTHWVAASGSVRTQV